MKIYRLLVLIGFILYGFGIYLIWQRNNPDRLAFSNFTAPSEIKKTPYNPSEKKSPVAISIPDVRINLPLYPSRIINDVWETTTEGASYLVSSPIPGAKGNSIVYAHDWNNLFGNLLYVEPGIKVIVEYSDGSKSEFIIESTKVVAYNDASVLNDTDEPVLTLYTCTGFLDSQRFVAVAKYKNNFKPLSKN